MAFRDQDSAATFRRRRRLFLKIPLQAGFDAETVQGEKLPFRIAELDLQPVGGDQPFDLIEDGK